MTPKRSGETVHKPGVDRRSAADRRHRSAQSFVYQFFKGQRVGERRSNYTGPHYYVDVHSPGLLLVILLTLTMCIADAYLTLTLLKHGAEELNPVMKALIEHDVAWFFYSKYTVTALSLIVLLMHKNTIVFGVAPGHLILLVLLLAYTMLVGYEIKLMAAANLRLLD